MAATIDVLDPADPKRVAAVRLEPEHLGADGLAGRLLVGGADPPLLGAPPARLPGRIASPDGGALEADSYSDPRDKSGYSAEDLISLGFVNSPEHARLVEDSQAARRRLGR